VRVPRSERTYKATRAGGPGGQHVNTSATRIELWWNVETTQALDDAQRARLRDKLANRLDGEGYLRVVASKYRSQHQNREEATARLQAILARALRPEKKRRRTAPPRASKEERLRDKKHRAEVKKGRDSPPFVKGVLVLPLPAVTGNSPCVICACGPAAHQAAFCAGPGARLRRLGSYSLPVRSIAMRMRSSRSPIVRSARP
jgi:ribosome-associated protein